MQNSITGTVLNINKIDVADIFTAITIILILLCICSRKLYSTLYSAIFRYTVCRMPRLRHDPLQCRQHPTQCIWVDAAASEEALCALRECVRLSTGSWGCTGVQSFVIGEVCDLYGVPTQSKPPEYLVYYAFLEKRAWPISEALGFGRSLLKSSCGSKSHPETPISLS